MIDRRIKVRHIQCFVEIAREGSFKAAAKKLLLTQPAMSKTLKELEDTVGIQLFTRSRAGVSLTAPGETFLHFAQMALASLQQGLDSVDKQGRLTLETLRVGSLPSVATRIMPDVATEFFRFAPRARLQITDGPVGYLIDLLKLGQLDVVVGRAGSPNQMKGVSFTQLYNEEVVFVVRPGHPMLDNPRLDRLGRWQVVFPPKGAAIRPLVERFLIARGVGECPNRIETVSGAFGRAFVPSSDAVWIISGGVVAREVAAGRLVKLPFDTTLTLGPVGLMARPGTLPTPAQHGFEQAVNSVVEAHGLT